MNTTEDFRLWFHKSLYWYLHELYMWTVSVQPQLSTKKHFGDSIILLIFPLAYPNMATANKQAATIFNKEMELWNISVSTMEAILTILPQSWQTTERCLKGKNRQWQRILFIYKNLYSICTRCTLYPYTKSICLYSIHKYNYIHMDIYIYMCIVNMKEYIPIYFVKD